MSTPVLSIHGVEIPRLGLGTYKLTGDACVRAVRTALELGYRHIDTAEMYANEAEVGRGLRESGVAREAVFLTTKVWHTHLGRADVPRAVDAGLRALGTDYVDLLLVHWPTPDVPLEETLDAFREVQAAGKTRLIGVSNFPAPLLEQALALAPEIAGDQVEHHPFLGQPKLRGLVHQHGLFLGAYRPLGRGDVLHDQTIQTVAATHGASATQVALAWLLADDRIVAIPKATSHDHLADNLGALALTLTEDDVEAIDRLPKHRRGIDPAWAPDWEA